MTSDWVFNVLALTVFCSVLGMGILVGFLWGNHLGQKALKQEMLANGWTHNGWSNLVREPE